MRFKVKQKVYFAYYKKNFCYTYFQEFKVLKVKILESYKDSSDTEYYDIQVVEGFPDIYNKVPATLLAEKEIEARKILWITYGNDILKTTEYEIDHAKDSVTSAKTTLKAAQNNLKEKEKELENYENSYRIRKQQFEQFVHSGV